MSNRQIDNSHLAEKVALRYHAIKQLNSCAVLDVYHGTGKIWDEIGKRYKKLKVTGIEKEYKKGKDSIYGDNLKLLPVLDLSLFEVIDLNAYGIPAPQMVEVLANQSLKAGTIIFYTIIFSSFGGIGHVLLKQLGYTKNMIKKIPTIFNKNGFEKWCFFLANLGIKEIFDINPEYNKHYGYFIVDNKD